MTTGKPVPILSGREVEELHRLEEIIKGGIKSFFEVGRALQIINKKRLYRGTHAAFEDYCRERWGFTRQHAHRLIGAAGVKVSPIGLQPDSERVARELVGLDQDTQQEVWSDAVGEAGGQPTASGVADARVEALARKALAALSPEEQAEVLRAGEQRLGPQTKPQRDAPPDGAGRAGRIARGIWHAKQTGRLFGPAEPADEEWVDAFMAMLAPLVDPDNEAARGLLLKVMLKIRGL